MIKKYFFYLLLVNLFIPVFCQWSMAQTVTEDVIELNNGSIIRGKLKEYIADSCVKIESYRNIWAFPLSDVKNIHTDTIPENEYNGYFPRSNGPSFKSRGLHLETSFGLQFGFNDIPSGSPGTFSATLYYRTKPGFAAGISAGTEKYDYNILPVDVSLRFHFFDKTLSPYLFFNGGFSFPLAQDSYVKYYGGINGKGGIGLYKKIGAIALNCAVSYKYQVLRSKYSYDWYYYYGNTEYTNYYYRVCLELGICF